MIDERFYRTALLLGDSAIETFSKKHIIVFGLGGVGSYAVEALARSGIGEITLVDNDKVSVTNINRQIIALTSTVGKNKVDAEEERLKDINPNIIIHKNNSFILPENISQFDFSKYDYIVDCIDTISTKIALIEKSPHKIITCLGTGNKLDPMGFKVSTIEKTSVCPLAKVIRKKLKEKGINNVKCVYSQENPMHSIVKEDEEKTGRHSPASISFVPAAAGLLIASEVLKSLL